MRDRNNDPEGKVKIRKAKMAEMSEMGGCVKWSLQSHVG